MIYRISISAVLVLWMTFPCLAAVTGYCVDCHTMHNSQDGSAVSANVAVESGSLSTVDTDPISGLLKTNCIGCHQGTNSGGTTPYVLDLTSHNYGQTGTGGDTLAGGNFYWVSQGSDSSGHNVVGIAAADGTPPGDDNTTLTRTQLTCAGTGGCHGDPSETDQVASMYKSHHWSETHPATWKDGTSLADSYRFLLGVQGMGDSDYEYQPTADRHNKYYGVDRTYTTGENDEAADTISGFCAKCHGLFHDIAGSLANEGIASGTFGTSGVWVRHPSNFDMSGAASGSEYDYYNGGTGTGNTYSVISPVATADTSTTINSTVFSQSDDAIVMCISCHRAHGTPYKAILRWDYQNWPGSGYNGCAVCHTSKD